MNPIQAGTDGITVSYHTDVGSMNRSRFVRLADLSEADRAELWMALSQDRRRPEGVAAFSSLTLTINGKSFSADPQYTPELFKFARRMLGGPGTFGNDPAW